ncbi:hypothetical protein LOC68_07865 [Blastopirellula sp. JC732]|uniref:Uncharacterized protein n=1 Tax=Blastopirellula sediminis TaxID=2894196 RepID=A0A9X1ML52_9BACT|nr:hypothetical protein [Blastopirellula sediminis]MCC9608916.1 hypothetical protein [Blastopirellula sediminis]MCC9628307.1 hypothetical protein [Blastopirellula sediminis]
MNTNWLHHEEARNYAVAIEDRQARAALRGVHTLLLESCGATPLYSLERQLRPIFPLDLRVVYRCVASLFSEWKENAREAHLTKNENVRNLDNAKEYVSRLNGEREKTAQLNFVQLLCEAALKENKVIDVLFCCELLHPILSDDDALDNILSGRAENCSVDVWQDY